MKITESRIRQYIRKILMETIYGTVGGAPAQTRDQFEMQPGNKGILKSIPADVAPVDRSFPAKLAMEAKEEFESMQQGDSETFDLIAQKVFPIAFGFTYDELLDNLTFTPSDLKYVNIDIKNELKDKNNFNQMMMTLESFMPKTAAYLKHITTATDDFSRDDSRAFYTTLSPDTNPVLGRSSFAVFFKTPDNPGDKGMGKSLIDLIFEKIMSAILSVQSQTPVEFANQLYPEFETYINTMFANNPIIQNNVKNKLDLDKIRKGYLDSIRYVLIELIAEMNFEFLYYGDGTEINSKDPNQLLLFLPDDRSILKKSSEAATWMVNRDPRANSGENFGYYVGDFYRPDSWVQSEVPAELRSMPSYYDTKFSINPALRSTVGKQISAQFNSRLYDNIMFSVGFEKEGIDVPDDLYWGGLSELWYES